MSLGSIPLPRRVSDAQFVGDLFGLFKRHRIETGEVGSFAQFESLLASKDAFRSQLFTLCTAISHMADADLSGEQLFDLIARALDASDAGNGSARKAFLNGYDAWSNRSLDETDTWPPVREPAHAPIPFPQPADSLSEPDPPATRPQAVRPPGTRTVQEALLMAKKESAFELPPRAASAPAAVASAPPTSVEGLTISELTKLLEDIEHRMTRIKPQMTQLNELVMPAGDGFERQGRVRDFGDGSKAGIAAQWKPSLVATSVSPSIEETLLMCQPDPVKEDKFMARHAYLNPGRRLAPNTPVPELRALVAPVVPPLPYIPPAATPIAASPVAFAPSLAPAPPVVPASPVVFAVPESAMMAAAAPAPSELAVPGPVLLQNRLESGVVVDHSAKFPIAVAYKSEKFRLYFHIAVAVFAAFILVGLPLMGVVVVRTLLPTHRYVYHDLRPDVQPGETPSSTAIPASGLPAAAPWGSVAPAKQNAARSATHPQSAQPSYPARRNSTVAVWPPPPQ